MNDVKRERKKYFNSLLTNDYQRISKADDLIFQKSETWTQVVKTYQVEIRRLKKFTQDEKYGSEQETADAKNLSVNMRA